MQRYTHELKINPQYFNQVRIGAKKAEFRRADRDFQVGDIWFYVNLMLFHQENSGTFF
ncbi:DUF3850 domain-containing protein, partial [Proteus mirabilis]|uniref:DUF3850 domain-containing protein n=1 Tax=Proteus mirabilis TaxID=584 RepID=UPI0013D1E240